MRIRGKPLWMALGSAGISGTIGYSLHAPQANKTQEWGNQTQITELSNKLKRQGYVEVRRPDNLIHRWHQNYMYSHAIGAQPRISLFDPSTKVTEAMYEISSEQVAHLTNVYPTIFDEGLAHVACQGLPNQIGVTGTLEISSLDTSTLPENGGILILRAQPIEARGRKSSCSGELLWAGTREPIARGKVIMIEPWWGKYVSKFM